MPELLREAHFHNQRHSATDIAPPLPSACERGGIAASSGGKPATMAAAWQSPLGRFDQAFDAQPFAAWCKKHKVLLLDCSIATCEETGRCVLASRDIAKDSVVVEVPDEAVLMGESSRIAEKLAGGGCCAAPFLNSCTPIATSRAQQRPLAARRHLSRSAPSTCHLAPAHLAPAHRLQPWACSKARARTRCSRCWGWCWP
jgi:hypothetical protein